MMGFGAASAQTSGPVRAFFSAERKDDSTVFFTVKVNTDKGLQLFTTKKRGDDDPFVSTTTFDSGSAKFLNPSDTVVERGSVQTLNVPATNGPANVYADSVSFIYTMHIPGSSKSSIKGEFSWLGIQGDNFPNGAESFEVALPQPATSASTDTKITSAEPVSNTGKSGWALFVICLLTGFGAVFTPCVFPLIPVTVSFFLKRSKTKPEGIRNAWLYGLSIILIYTIPTLIFTLIFGDKFLYQLSTHPITNLLFFAIFIVFALSFFGAFELTLPSSWAGKADEKAGKGGLSGIFFMALTLVIVSFSCTGPLVAALLGQTSGQGIGLGPVIGMLGFGVGLALPFGVFALFPNMLKSLPKSGGWLNTVKVFFGFLELALAMKFLSNADLVYHWGLLSRDVFLSIWIVIFLLLGLYLLGKIKMSHDSELAFISIPRLFFAMASLMLAVYMVPGLWGAPLTPLSGILPPPSTQKFNLDDLQYKVGTGNAGQINVAPRPVKYADKFHVPFGLTAYFDLEEAKAVAKAMNKPIMIDFTGWSCANCRKMENEVWSDATVLKVLREDFVLVSLYVDDKTPLPEAEQYTNAAGEKIKTIGAKNLDYETSAFNLNAQPLYMFVDNEGKPLSDRRYGYDPDVEKFLAHLAEVKATYKTR